MTLFFRRIMFVLFLSGCARSTPRIELHSSKAHFQITHVETFDNVFEEGATVQKKLVDLSQRLQTSEITLHSIISVDKSLPLIEALRDFASHSAKNIVIRVVDRFPTIEAGAHASEKELEFVQQGKASIRMIKSAELSLTKIEGRLQNVYEKANVLLGQITEEQKQLRREGFAGQKKAAMLPRMVEDNIKHIQYLQGQARLLRQKNMQFLSSFVFLSNKQ